MLLLLLACARVSAPTASAPPADCPRVFLGQPGITSLPGIQWLPDQAPEGLDPDLAQLLMTGLGCPLDLVGAEAEGTAMELRFSLLEQGRADLSIFQISVTEERQQRVDFTQPYAVDGVSLVVPEDSSAATLDDLAQARIVASQGSTAEAWVRTALPDATVLVHPRTHQDIKDCFDAAPDSAEHCDALAGDHSALAYGTPLDSRVRLLPGGPFTREPWAVAVAKGDDALLQRLDAVLAAAEGDGSLDTIRARWGMPSP